MNSPRQLQLFLTPRSRCNYFPQRWSVSLLADPSERMGMAAYGHLVALGFRRSGDYVYRPHCPGCKACISARIPVADFRCSRSQRRTQTLNADLEVTLRPVEFVDEHFELYLRYQRLRHTGGGMDHPDPDRYSEFLSTPWAETRLVEFRLAEQLVAVAVTDMLPGGLSAVYTFYDPGMGRRGLGTYSVLWQVEEARRRALPHVYLGYWIRDHEKMRYKSRFRPLELYEAGKWRRMEAGEKPDA